MEVDQKFKDADASRVSHAAWTILLNAPGLQPAVLKLVYLALVKDGNDARANLMMMELMEEFLELPESVFLNEYVATKQMSDETLRQRMKEEVVRRLHRAKLAKHVSERENFPAQDFLEPDRFVPDQGKIDSIRARLQAKGWSGPSIFDAALRLLAYRAGFLNFRSNETPTLGDFGNADNFSYTNEWNEFLNSTDVFIDQSLEAPEG